jgi:hypothetical protein
VSEGNWGNGSEDRVGALGIGKGNEDIPNTFQMHGTDLDDLFLLLCFEDSVAPTSSHAYYVEKLGPINHVVICCTLLLA